MSDSLCSLVARDLASEATVRRRNAAAAADGICATMAIDVLAQAVAVTRMLAKRCRREYGSALRLACPPLAAAAIEHANDVGMHTSRLDERFRALGGRADRIVDLPPERNGVDANSVDALQRTIVDDLTAVRAAVQRYRSLAELLATLDPPAHRILAAVIDGESARADDLAALLDRIATPDRR